MTIEEMIATKEARKKELATKSKASTDINEVRSINDQIDALNTDITELRGMKQPAAPVAPATTPISPNAAPVAPGTEVQRSAEVAAEAEARAKGMNGQQFSPLASYAIGNGTQLQGEKRGLDAILGMPTITAEQQAEMRSELYATAEYRSAFFKTLLGKPLTDTEKRAYDSSSSVAVIPTTTSDILFSKMVKVAPLINEITLLRIAGNVKFGIQGERDDAALHTENAAVTPAGDTLVYVELGGYDITKVVRISKNVQTMAIAAFENWLTDLLAQDIAVKIEDFTINGTGSSQPLGVDKANTWDATNSIQYTKGGSPTYDNVVDMISLLPARYTGNAKFLCNNKFLYGMLAKIKDDQKRPILVQDFSNPIAQRILGFPVLISDKVPAGSLFFGDFKQMVGNLSQDVTVETSTASGFLNRSIDYLGSAIYDCDVALKDAFTKMFEATV